MGKIPVKNIYYMLAYAFRALGTGAFADLSSEDFDDAQDLFAAIMLTGVNTQLKRGLYREYTLQTEDLLTMRGKLDVPGTSRLRGARSRRLTCEFDELMENNLLNQVLKTTALILVRHGSVKDVRRVQLRRALACFGQVDEIDPSRIQWSTLHYGRTSASYRVLMGLCELVVEGMLLTDERGQHRLRSFTDDQRMSMLYEKFILEYYARHWACLHPRASEVKWSLDDGEGFMLPAMRTDITLSSGDSELIIDAKYYARNTQEHFSHRSIHSANLYQIFTYVKNREAEMSGRPHELSGMLLYARTDDEVQPEGTYAMSGNRISVATLDLNKDFKEISKALDDIARKQFPAAVASSGHR